METVPHAGAKETLKSAIFLHSVTLVRQNLSWYLIKGVISSEAASELDAVWNAAVKAFVPHMNTAVMGLGVA